MVWPERYRQVGYYYEKEKDVFKLKPRGRALTNTLEQMFQEEAVPQVGEKKEWVEVETGLSLCKTSRAISRWSAMRLCF